MRESVPERHLARAVEERRRLVVRHARPCSDLLSLTRAELDQRLSSGEPLEFGHLLEDQIGGQLDAGFVLTGFYEDRRPDALPDRYIPTMLATRAEKLRR